jgi:hypothetical protein
MAYYIDIIDTTSPLTKLVLEDASASGIVLKWNGGDSKDEMAIVSSEFNFDMLTKTAEDAAFIEFFTGDEHRYKVLVKNYVGDSVVWQGYILPDLYSEPYKNVCFFVSFTATDGLGRLKGKYLPDEYYSREKSLIDIFCQCLKLTGLELDLYFNPAIENFTNKDWNTIYVDTADFLNKEKKQDAYKILQTLLEDTLCVCYQADNRWYIEGINTRHLRKVTYKVYDVDGQFVSNVVYNRLLKQITPLVTPTVTIIPPYNEITITHPKIEPSIPKTACKEVNDGWALVTGVKGTIYNSDWVGHGGLYAICDQPDYYTRIYNEGHFTGDGSLSYPQDNTRWVSLKEKIYFAKAQKITFNLEFSIVKFISVVSDVIDYELWKNPFKYEIVLNGVVVFTNFKENVSDNENIFFEESGTVKKEFQHIVTADSLLDIRIYAPFGSLITTKIMGIELRSAAVSVIGFKDEEIITDLISGDFTVDKELELTYGDDKSGTSKGFRLKKLKEQTTFFNAIQAPILYGFSNNGKFYSVMSLQDANLIDENRFQVFKEGVLIPVIDVFYNFNDGEQMVVETEIAYTSGFFVVHKYAVDDLLDNRTTWQQWTDAIYQIENTSYAKTVSNIYRRMFNAAHEKIDCVALNAVKFNDVVLFKYVYPKDFYLLNCSWNLDENKTTITVGRSIYKDATATVPGDDNVPPIVLAGDDIYLTDLQTTASLTSNAYDPDGFIASQQWTKTSGTFGGIIDSPFALNTDLTNLTGDYYTYQIQVTDNDGATALDTVNVIRKKDYQIIFEELYYNEVETLENHAVQARYKLVIDPNIPEGFVLNLEGIYKILVEVSRWSVYGYLLIEKNGVVLEEYVTYGAFSVPVLLNYIATDEIFFTIEASASAGSLSGETASFASINSSVQFDTVNFINGQGTVINLPAKIEIRAAVRE